MNSWGAFLDSLDTPGGHILILLLLLAAGIVSGHMELTTAAMTALFVVLRGAVSNYTRKNGTG